MKISKLSGVAWLVALCTAGTALAQSAGRSNLSTLAPVPEPTGVGYAVAADQPSTPSASPVKPDAPATAEKPAVERANGGEAASDDEKSDEDTGFKLFKGQWLQDRRIDIRGWIDQGYTWNPDRPTTGFNGPVGYNDRSNEYMMNQFYLITERVTKPEDGEWDWGGHVNLLYGTDQRFVTAFGLDDRWNEGERFYGLAMPQLYGDLAYGKFVFRAGHMLAPCGYENVMSPENFFYSHSYAFIYGQPTTITGTQTTWNLNDRFSINGGIDSGWNAFESINDKIGAFGGVNWKSRNEKTTVALEGFINNEHPSDTGLNSVRSHFCLVVTHKFGEKITWAAETQLRLRARRGRHRGIPPSAASAPPTPTGSRSPTTCSTSSTTAGPPVCVMSGSRTATAPR